MPDFLQLESVTADIRCHSSLQRDLRHFSSSLVCTFYPILHFSSPQRVLRNFSTSLFCTIVSWKNLHFELLLLCTFQRFFGNHKLFLHFLFAFNAPLILFLHFFLHFMHQSSFVLHFSSVFWNFSLCRTRSKCSKVKTYYKIDLHMKIVVCWLLCTMIENENMCLFVPQPMVFQIHQNWELKLFAWEPDNKATMRHSRWAFFKYPNYFTAQKMPMPSLWSPE